MLGVAMGRYRESCVAAYHRIQRGFIQVSQRHFLDCQFLALFHFCLPKRTLTE